ncbi:hypothetical protein SAMN05444339_10245 [Loktanella atrilutea]|uniref:Uncharacterized protein n=1 Tax=Loktanella atrilutea TaxID=366533 RepID=A0A1M4WAF0_LOKAT|nr:hypothetical protein [Loktanella atrilutea]SHE78145.1 hypothetical protein SAMN05444339_10245 [Loktanella atrilutea]
MTPKIETIRPAPIAVQMARDSIDLMTQEQRVALAIEIVRDITSSHCVQHLLRLGSQATTTGNEIARTARIAAAEGRA